MEDLDTWMQSWLIDMGRITVTIACPNRCSERLPQMLLFSASSIAFVFLILMDNNASPKSLTHFQALF